MDEAISEIGFELFCESLKGFGRGGLVGTVNFGGKDQKGGR